VAKVRPDLVYGLRSLRARDRASTGAPAPSPTVTAEGVGA
jgi:hypothetical protein